MSGGINAKQNDLSWLGKEAPRYTSYPTAHHFSNAVNAEQHAAWLSSIREDTTISVYVHIPFCREMCWFCGCNTKAARRYEPVAKYIKVLLKEIALVKSFTKGRGTLLNIHFGGGSPSLLEADDMSSILQAIGSAFQRKSGGEQAIELDPRTTTAEKIALYKKLGFNRASIGIQDFDREVQQAINRVQSYEQVAEVFGALRHAGISDINCDLIYGLPKQHYSKFTETLEKTLSLKPSRISLFSYAHVPQIKKHQRLIDTSWLPTDSEKLELFMIASRWLVESGYIAIGMDHFAMPDDPLAIAYKNRTMRRNFQGYVTDTTDVLIGVGCSAISQFPQGYSQNNPEAAGYGKMVESGSLPTLRGWVNRDDDLIRKRIIDELMCFMSVDIERVRNQFGLKEGYFTKELAQLAGAEFRDIVSINREQIAIVTPYLMAARVVASVFDSYKGETVRQYSKVA